MTLDRTRQANSMITKFKHRPFTVIFKCHANISPVDDHLITFVTISSSFHLSFVIIYEIISLEIVDTNEGKLIIIDIAKSNLEFSIFFSDIADAFFT